MDEAQAAVKRQFTYDLESLSFDSVELALQSSITAYNFAWREHTRQEPCAITELTSPMLGIELAELLGKRGERTYRSGDAMLPIPNEGKMIGTSKIAFISQGEDMEELQPTDDLEQLFQDAESTQRILKHTLVPGSDWAQCEKPPKDLRTLDASQGARDKGLPCWLDAVTDPGVKSRERTLLKAEYKYKNCGGVARVRDLARLALQFDTAEHLMKSLERILSLFDVLCLENRFAQPTALGWADVTILVRVLHGGTTEYHIAELQLQLRAFVRAREAAHKHYGQLRALLPEAGVSPEHLDPVMRCILTVLDS
eukprot:gnl/TRDRNA2_/TRDRNA2_170414_c0_seq1.p1 gnl/TRDRNA2_/TRDRNA2_170414_c0~~gnl/TRDRNA2_/TRDRNA2_170414_c0_seq1.p1  ORF type:complete len:345 (+),score=56.13 gnl/TRDRNA2_/TRDRNA2_170414_c0_seq1:105-1037(+)